MLNKVFKVSISFIAIFVLFKFLVFPVGAYFYYKDSFIQYSAKCANAMDEAWFIQQTKDKELMKTAEINMLDCHEYDKLQKKMQIFGVSREIISYLGLESLELNQRPFQEFTREHYFRER